MHEVAVGGAVRCHHRHVRFGHLDRVVGLRQHHSYAGAQHDAELPPCYYQTQRFVVLFVLLKMILITHSVRSLSRPVARLTARPRHFTSVTARWIRTFRECRRVITLRTHSPRQRTAEILMLAQAANGGLEVVTRAPAELRA